MTEKPHDKYGFCHGCSFWVPRNGMRAINVTTYDGDNKEDKIRIRLCPDCFHVRVQGLMMIRWNNRVVEYKELVEKYGTDSIKKT